LQRPPATSLPAVARYRRTSRTGMRFMRLGRSRSAFAQGARAVPPPTIPGLLDPEFPRDLAAQRPRRHVRLQSQTSRLRTLRGVSALHGSSQRHHRLAAGPRGRAAPHRLGRHRPHHGERSRQRAIATRRCVLFGRPRRSRGSGKGERGPSRGSHEPERGPGPGCGQRHRYAESRLRPRALRRLRIARPPREDMRARKPCRRFRRLTFG